MHLRALALCLTLIALIAAPIASAQDDSFRLGVGDKLRITVFEEPDMTGEYVVGARGRLSLPLIGEVAASDLTLSELETRITEALADGFITNASVSVELLESRPFYILGDVSTPGSYPYVDGMTVVNAIALAGGNLLTADDEVRAMVDVARSRERRDLLAKEYLSTLAREARLVAERDDLEQILFPPELVTASQHEQIRAIVDGEIRFFEARRSILVDQANVIEELKAGVRKEIAAYNTQMAAVRDQVALMQNLLDDQNKLLAQNLTRKAQVMDLQIRTAGSRVTRGGLLVNLARAEQRLQELELRATDSRNQFISEVADGLNQAQSNLSRIRTSLQTAQEELRQNRRKLGRARSALAGDRQTQVRITRRTDTGVVEIEAEDNTPIAPGDIVRVADELDQSIEDVTFDIASLIEGFSGRQQIGARPAPLPAETSDDQEAATESMPGADSSSGTDVTDPQTEGAESGESAATSEPSTNNPTSPDEEAAVPDASSDAGDTNTTIAALPQDDEGSEPTTDATADDADSEAGGMIKSIQIGLNVLGYVGNGRLSVDGIMGPRTEDAIKAYQAKHDLPVDGAASPDLLKHIQSQLN